MTRGVASVVGGALAPIIATLLAATALGSAAVGTYLVAVCCVSLLATIGLARYPNTSSARAANRPRNTV